MLNLYLIDSNSYLYKSYYSFADKSDSRGNSISAIYGFTNFILKFINACRPEYLGVIFENTTPPRPMMPPDLKSQIAPIKKILYALRIPQFEIPGYEINDVLATIATYAISFQNQSKIYIISSDKDILQIVSDNINVINPNQDNRIFNTTAIKEEFGVEPRLIPDLLSLSGDEPDNIMGVPGIGKKTAIMLLEKFGSLEGIIKNFDKINSDRLKDVIKRYARQALQNKKIAVIDKTTPLKINLEELKFKEFDIEKASILFRQYELLDLLSIISSHKSFESAKYIKINEIQQLDSLIEELEKMGEFSIDTETTSVEPMKAEIVGISVSFAPDSAFYIPIGHKGKEAEEQLDKKIVIERLRPILENENIKKIGQNIKYDKIIFDNLGIRLQGIIFDTMVASYLINPQTGTHGLDDLALKYLNYKMLSTKEVIGAHKDMSEVDIDKVTQYACEDADITLKLKEIFLPLLEKEGLKDVFEQVEMPLVEVIAEMEIAGVKINKEYLIELSSQLNDKIEETAKLIYSHAGEVFNINSAQQLSRILFEKLKLPPTKKTQLGFTTTLSALERLKEKHQIVRLLIQHKTLASAKSSHIDPLLELANPKTGKIHTSFHQTATQTGRLSSSGPNLQNVPIRQNLGEYIRKAFLAEEGDVILSCDYSQIELRILAHFSKDQILLKAFSENIDIHTQTASSIFNAPIEKISPEMRNKAKVVNFGIIYGMSPIGLAKELNITEEEALRYITSYFNSHANVKKFIQETLAFAKENGFVKTLLGRKRYLPEINSFSRNLREAAKREAINTPIQGSAADVIKLAMVKIYEDFKKKKLLSNLIMQIHDELVFEIRHDELEIAKDIIKNRMENAYPLLVPLKIKAGYGKNWFEAHA